MTAHEVIDPRIDVAAQRAILRMRSRDPVRAQELLGFVKNGELRGFVADDLAMAVDHARELGTVRWELVPAGRDAAVVPGNTSRPLAVFRASAREDRSRMDAIADAVHRETLEVLEKARGGPPPLGRQQAPPTKQAVHSFLAGRLQRDIAKAIADRSERLTVFAEVHHNDRHKSKLFWRLLVEFARRPGGRRHFFASEGFLTQWRPEIEAYLQAPSATERLARFSSLPKRLRNYRELLEGAAQFPARSYSVLTAGLKTRRSDTVRGADARHKAIFGAFEESRALAGIVPASARGKFLLGAFHAARHHVDGRPAPTTTRLLIDAGWGVHVVRLLVDRLETVVGPTGIQKLPDTHVLEPLRGGGRSLDLLEVLRAVAQDQPCYAQITGAGSPFSELKLKGKVARSYSELYDAVLYLPRELILMI